jgi:DNA modification methylase
MKPFYEDDLVTLYHGDCRSVLPTIQRQSFDLLLTDPPYGINYVGRGQHGPIAGDDGATDLLAALATALRLLKFNRHFYVFGPQDISSLTTGATTELIWDKRKHGAGNLSIPWGTSHEKITFGVWNPYKSQAGVGAHLARLRRGTVLAFPTVNQGKGALKHPTEKPVPLLRELIEASSRMGEVILDPFAGAGSTLLAAKAEGRRAVGVELEERYCEIAAKRLAQAALFGGAA